MAGQHPVSISALRPLAVQSGCGLLPAKSVWLPVASQTLCLPHPRVGKISFPGHAGNGATGALPTGETILGCDPAFSFVLRKRGRRRETVRTDLLHNGGNSGPNRPEAAGDPYPSRKRGTQGLTGGYVGLFRSTRRLVIRWRSVDSSNYSR